MTSTSAVDGSGTDRRGLAVLGFEECLRRLSRTRVGRLTYVSAGELVVLPVNHAVDGANVIFRTAHGEKLQVASEQGHVAFEVDRYDEAAETGWSVVVKGTAERVYESALTDRYDAMGLRSWADPEGQGQWVRIRPSEISGRELRA
jgi:uncharacterized protein